MIFIYYFLIRISIICLSIYKYYITILSQPQTAQTNMLRGLNEAYQQYILTSKQYSTHQHSNFKNTSKKDVVQMMAVLGSLQIQKRIAKDKQANKKDSSHKVLDISEYIKQWNDSPKQGVNQFLRSSSNNCYTYVIDAFNQSGNNKSYQKPQVLSSNHQTNSPHLTDKAERKNSSYSMNKRQTGESQSREKIRDRSRDKDRDRDQNKNRDRDRRDKSRDNYRDSGRDYHRQRYQKDKDYDSDRYRDSYKERDKYYEDKYYDKQDYRYRDYRYTPSTQNNAYNNQYNSGSSSYISPYTSNSYSSYNSGSYTKDYRRDPRNQGRTDDRKYYENKDNSFYREKTDRDYYGRDNRDTRDKKYD